MIILVHLLFGAAIGSLVKNVPIAIVLAFLSHYFLDLFPHIEYSVGNTEENHWRIKLPAVLKMMLDFCLGILLLSIFSNDRPIIFIYALSSMLPDGLTVVNYFLPNKILKVHENFHVAIHFLKYKKIPNFWRISSQVLSVMISMLLLLR